VSLSEKKKQARRSDPTGWWPGWAGRGTAAQRRAARRAPAPQSRADAWGSAHGGRTRDACGAEDVGCSTGSQGVAREDQARHSTYNTRSTGRNRGSQGRGGGAGGCLG
jgi:hypothetical protein